MHALNGSGFDTWNILNNWSCERRIVDSIESGMRMNWLKSFDGKVDNKPQNLFFRFGMSHLIFSLKCRQNFYFTEIIVENWIETRRWWYLERNKSWVVRLCEKQSSFTAFSYAGCSKGMEELTGLGKEECLSLPGLVWKIINSLKKTDEPIYLYHYEYTVGL